MSADKTDARKLLDRHDILGLIGAALISTGLWMIYPPLSLIVLGAGCVWLAIRGATVG